MGGEAVFKVGDKVRIERYQYGTTERRKGTFEVVKVSPRLVTLNNGSKWKANGYDREGTRTRGIGNADNWHLELVPPPKEKIFEAALAGAEAGFLAGRKEK